MWMYRKCACVNDKQAKNNKLKNRRACLDLDSVLFTVVFSK